MNALCRSILCLAMMLPGCTANTAHEENSHNDWVADFFLDTERGILPKDVESSTILILPITGCEACVDATLDFIKQNKALIEQKDNFRVFITQVPEARVLNQRLGSDVLKMNNITIDYKNEFVFNGVLTGPNEATFSKGRLDVFKLIEPQDLAHYLRVLRERLKTL